MKPKSTNLPPMFSSYIKRSGPLSTERLKYPRPSYESDPARLKARIEILRASPARAERDALIRYLESCLQRLAS